MTVTIDDITTHTSTAVVLVRGSGFTDAEAAAMRADMDTFLGTTIPQTMANLTDVSDTAPNDGDVQAWNATTEQYEPVTPPTGPRVRNGDDSVYVDNATAIIAQAGVTVTTNGSFPTFAYIEPQYGGTGSKNLLPHSDHSHTQPTIDPVTYTSKGTLSSGAVTLVSTNVTLPAAGVGEIAKVYTVTVRTRDTQTGLGGSSYYTPKITIGGTASTSWERRTVGGVPLPGGYEFTRQITGAGTSVAILAELIFSSGDPLTVEAGAIYIDVDCNR